MAEQHSIRSKQSEKGADVDENHLLSDEVDIFNQLQSEFDMLVSGGEPEAGEEMIASGDKNRANDDQETIHHKADTSIASEEERPTAIQKQEPPSVQDAVDETPPLTEQSSIADASDNTTLASATKASDNSPPNTKKAPSSTIMMIVFAVAILMAIIAGSIWIFNYPASQQSASSGQAGKAVRQVIIKKATGAVKYIPTDKSDSSVNRQSPAQATDPAATSRRSSTQPGASHNKVKPIPSTSTQSSNWIINLESFNAQNDANAYTAKLRRHDIHADVMAIQIKGKAWYRVRLTGFPSKREAEKQRLILVKKLSLNSAWISKSRH